MNAISGLLGGEHLWSIDESFAGSPFGGAISVDLSDQATGVLGYSLDTGIFRSSTSGDLSGTTSNLEGRIINVNSQESSFGSGWGLAGLQKIVEHEQFKDVVLLVDDDGTESMFIVPFGPGLAYQSPPGDFSKLEKIDDIFRRTLKDGTVYQFNLDNQLETVTDRNGNQTLYEYDVAGNISRMTDPAGLVTEFNYVEGMLTEIMNPNGIATAFEHDSVGNLMKITDADGSTREFGYNAKSLLTSEIDKRGNVETVEFDDDGRASSGIRADGTQVFLRSADSLGASRLSGANNSVDPPKAELLLNNRAVFVDGNGEATEYKLGASYLVEEARDEVGQLYSLTRSDTNLPTTVIDGNGNETRYVYDDRGNALTTIDTFAGGLGASNSLFATPSYEVGDGVFSVEAVDLNGDGFNELVGIDRFTDELHVLVGGLSGFGQKRTFVAGDRPSDFAIADFNGDGFLDAVVSTFDSRTVTFLQGRGDSTFEPIQTIEVGEFTRAIVEADFNGDGVKDFAVTNIANDFLSLFTFEVGNGFVRHDVSISSQPFAIHSSDVDQDGIDDLILSNTVQDSISVVFGNIDPNSYSENLLNVVGLESIRSIAIDASSSESPLWIADDSGSLNVIQFDDARQGRVVQSFYSGESSIDSFSIADFDSNGTSDFMLFGYSEDRVKVGLRASGSNQSTSIEIIGFEPDSATGPVSTGDANNDGFIDILIPRFNDKDLLAVHGDGSGEFPVNADRIVSGAKQPVDFVSADFNQDGFLDVVTVRTKQVAFLCCWEISLER